MLYAFNVQAFQIAGGPGWIRNDRYDVMAKPPESSDASRVNPPNTGAPLTEEQRQMLQGLLVDRFQLKFHRETRMGTIYALEKGKDALKLQPAREDERYPWVGSNAGGSIGLDGLAATDISMPVLASRLSAYIERPVLDKTGIQGVFDFKYERAADAENYTHEDVVASILSSIEAIGLKLKAEKGPMEIIVIDQIARPSAD